MTTGPGPRDPSYVDEASVRDELTRVFDVCHGCRRCAEHCTAFPTLFEMIAQLDDPGGAGGLTPAQQDRVVDACFSCKRCSHDCPYTPERHEWGVDVPRLMARAQAMRRAAGQRPVRPRIADGVLRRVGVLGRATPLAGAVADRVLAARPGSAVRKVAGAATGISAVRVLPPRARQRFTTWFTQRAAVVAPRRQGNVTVFPTCLVEHREPAIGKDLVRVYERNGIECSVTAVGCCGAALLPTGEVRRFAGVAGQNVRILADEVRAGRDIVVPQPTCASVLRNDYVEHVGESTRADAVLVAEHTYDAAEYLMRVHDAEESELDTEFTGDVPEVITYHAACHARPQHPSDASRELMQLTGAEVVVVRRCSGIGGTWGYRAENERSSSRFAEQLAAEIEAAGYDVVAGECHLANAAIAEQTGTTPSHPIQLLARAYGIGPDD
jgi:Fe-S oxidoreductase